MVEITCHGCKYTWNTHSVLNYATCPSCQAKVHNPTKRQRHSHRRTKQDNAEAPL